MDNNQWVFLDNNHCYNKSRIPLELKHATCQLKQPSIITFNLKPFISKQVSNEKVGKFQNMNNLSILQMGHHNRNNANFVHQQKRATDKLDEIFYKHRFERKIKRM